jgi:hypothetical protein
MLHSGRLNSNIDPRAKQCTRAPTYTATLALSLDPPKLPLWYLQTILTYMIWTLPIFRIRGVYVSILNKCYALY